MTGDGPIAVELAWTLRAEYDKIVLVSATPVAAEQFRAHRLLDVSGDPTDAVTLRAAGPPPTAAHAMTTRSDHVVIRMSEPSPFGAVLGRQQAMLDDAEGRLTIFEVIEEACVPKRIREDLADQLARAIHQAYVKNCEARGESPLVNPSMKRWEDLLDHLRQANLAQAADIGIKLSTIGCVVVPESATNPHFAFSDAEIELLAQLEHRRWMDERKGQGIVYGPVREGNQHPDLVDWQYLSEIAKGKDRDAIRELPMILWRAGFQILRLPPRSS